MEHVWIFNGQNSKLTGGVFINKSKAEDWIRRYKLSGILTKYPMDISVYEWAIEKSIFKPKNENHYSADFIGGFTSASMEHYHYENGSPD